MPAFAPVGDYTWNSDGYCTLICSLDGCCMWSCINQMHVWMYVRLDVWTPVQYIHVRLTHAHPNEYCMLDSHYAPKFWWVRETLLVQLKLLMLGALITNCIIS